MPVHAIPEPPTVIREATVADAAELSAFGREVFARTFGPDNDPADLAAYLESAFSESLQRREIEDPASTYLLAFEGGHLVAMSRLLVGATDPAVSGPAPVEIQRFYVDHNHHGRGLAARLMEATLAKAAERGGRTVWLGVWERNARAIRFYEKCGFVDVGTHIFMVGTDAQTDRVLMRTVGDVPVPEKVSLVSAFSTIDAHWQPRVAGTLNGQHVKLVKFQGEFVWHHHEHEDELFLVHRGAFVMEFRDRQVRLEAGDFLIVPRGVEHRPVAAEEVEVLLFEPVGTLNTGNVVNERTVHAPSSI